MSSSPYSPPTSDLRQNAPLPPRPPGIGLSCLLFGATTLLGFSGFLPAVDPELDYAQAETWLILAISALFGLPLSGLLLYCIWKGKNWARWTLTTLNIAGWLFTASQWPADYAKSHFLGGLDLTVAVFEMAACAMLFFGTGGQWFAAISRQR